MRGPVLWGTTAGTRRRAVARLGAAAVAALALVACGDAPSSDAGSGGPRLAVGSGGLHGTLLPTPSGPATAGSPPPGATVDRDSGARDEGGDAPPNYADNHAFRNTLALSPEQQRDGDLAASRIAAALDPLRPAVPYDEAAVAAALDAAGYPHALVSADSGSASFDVTVAPRVCVSGTLRAGAVATEVHGVYVEGGCREPRGGH